MISYGSEGQLQVRRRSAVGQREDKCTTEGHLQVGQHGQQLFFEKDDSKSEGHNYRSKEAPSTPIPKQLTHGDTKCIDFMDLYK